ncbi:MAG: PHP-associated domain-containing protein, partial [Actinomycetota bacterium]|nr:PHP-associated domain-containing protein [Actinomycetota bacterium]
MCRRHDIPVTLGSDAHAPEQVGFRFKYLLEQLKAAGYSEIVTFEGRQRRMVEIDWSLLERLPAL